MAMLDEPDWLDLLAAFDKRGVGRDRVCRILERLPAGPAEPEKLRERLRVGLAGELAAALRAAGRGRLADGGWWLVFAACRLAIDGRADHLAQWVVADGVDAVRFAEAVGSQAAATSEGSDWRSVHAHIGRTLLAVADLRRRVESDGRLNAGSGC
jgi:hypothetical protein